MQAKPDKQWLRARRELLAQVKGEVRARLGAESADLAQYGRRYENEFRKKWRLSTKPELLSAVESADLVYGADFHALGQAQRTHLKILRSFSGDRAVVLALECFGSNHQRAIDEYCAGRLSLEGLREKTKWERTWGFPWEHYRRLLELAKIRGFRVVALNLPGRAGSESQSDLEARERHAARLIAGAYRRAPGALIYTIFGDLHLAKTHLPKLVRGELSLKRPPKEVVIHLNSERIYFQLAKKGLELTADVVRLPQNRFCVMSTPPWVQWQSYLLFLEKYEDVDLDRGGAEEDIDLTDQVATLCRMAARDLGLEVKIDDLSVYSADDNRIWQALERKIKPREREIARWLLASGRSFFVPTGGAGYLAQATVNHAAALAGQYLHARLSRRGRLPWSPPRDFQALIWVEAMSYFVSKLINHKRQSETIHDLRAQLSLASAQDQGHEALKLALDQALSELVWIRQGRRRAKQFRPRRRSSYFEAARILGGMLGERLYLAYRSRKLSREEIVQYLRRDVTARNFARQYEEMIRRIGTAERIKSKRERL